MFDKISFLGLSFSLSAEPSGVSAVAASSQSNVGRPLSSASSISASEGNNFFIRCQSSSRQKRSRTCKGYNGFQSSTGQK